MQRINIWFCVKIDLDMETTKPGIHTVYDNYAMSDSHIAYWYREFKGGCQSIVDLLRASRGKSGRTAANIRAVSDAVEGDKRMNVSQISAATGVLRTSVFQILKAELNLVKRCAKFVPKLLTAANLALRRNCCEFLLRLIRQFPRVLSSVVAMDGVWVY